jgi:hypothetical protein
MKTRKLAWAICLVILTGTFTACDGLFDNTGLSIYSDYSNITLTVPQAVEGEYISSDELLTSDIDSAIKVANVDYTSIESIELTEVMTEILGNENGELSYEAFSSVIVTISNDILPEKVIAEITDIPFNADELTLNIQNTNVTDYLDAEKYYVSSYAVLNKNLENPMDILIKLRYKITLGF